MNRFRDKIDNVPSFCEEYQCKLSQRTERELLH